MKSYTTLGTLFTTLSQNSTAANLALGQQLINDRHRYLLQGYFDNLQTSYLTTVGGDDYTTTATMALGATSATLTAAWTLATGYQLTDFSNGDQRSVLFTNGSTAISWAVGLSDTATVDISTVGMQSYQIPQNISKVKDVTITVGQLKFTPAQILTQQDWDAVNFLPYTSDIPQYVYIYNNQMNVFPIPSTTGNIITFNYKLRVADFSYADYTTGTVAGTAGSAAITGTTTSWNTTGTYPLNVDLMYANLFIKINPPKGDGIWYQIRKFTSDTALTLVNPLVNNPVATGATYTIGQFPLLQEDFHDMIVYGALRIYFNSVVKDTEKFKLYDGLYKESLQLLEDYAGTRQVNVDLGTEPNPVNPNLFIYAQ
jgi:hypothetical protein